MAIVTGTFLTFSAIGNREDLTDIIWNISPVDLPFQANVAKTKASAVLHEWQRDVLAAAAANAQLEGDDSGSFTFAAAVPTVRVQNRAQISWKNVIVSGTQDAVNKAGRKREITLQLMKRSKELKRDCEFVLTQNANAAPVTGNSTTARVMSTIIEWYGIQFAGNALRGAGGANATATNGFPTTAVTDGTQRALTETLLKSAIQSIWTNGGDPDLLMPGPFNKTAISTFTGNTTRFQNTEDGKLNTAIDVYVSDFGTHKVIANKFSRDRDLHILTTDLVAVAELRPFQTIDLAKTGDSEKGMVLREYTLEVRNDAGIGVVADLTTA